VFVESKGKKRVVGYVVDPHPGKQSYVVVEGVGRCRTHFKRLVEDIDKGEVDIVMVATTELLFLDTAPLWLEKLIAAIKRHHVVLIDVTRNREYDLMQPEDEAAFRALKHAWESTAQE
jgi:DNA invertase Pin-like site-specific DNA recombinase